jgi:hypothetical protein
MNPAFTRYQQLPSLDALIVSASLAETGVRAESHKSVETRRSLFPLPLGGGQGEGKQVTMPTTDTQHKPLGA